MKSGVFLDRDGVIIKQVDDLQLISQLRLLPNAAPAIPLFNKLGLLVFIVTNQPVVARGWLRENELMVIHEELLNRLRKEGAYVNAVYYCPHHPDADMKKYRVKCLCRKPGTKMLTQAAREFHVDLKRSFIIGDHSRDILAGGRAGLTTIFVGNKNDDGSVRPNYTVKNLYAAAFLVKRIGRK